MAQLGCPAAELALLPGKDQRLSALTCVLCLVSEVHNKAVLKLTTYEAFSSDMPRCVLPSRKIAGDQSSRRLNRLQSVFQHWVEFSVFAALACDDLLFCSAQSWRCEDILGLTCASQSKEEETRHDSKPASLNTCWNQCRGWEQYSQSTCSQCYVSANLVSHLQKNDQCPQTLTVMRCTLHLIAASLLAQVGPLSCSCYICSCCHSSDDD